MIRHTVVFKLKNTSNASTEKAFFTEAMKLSHIPGVQNFECLKQTKSDHFSFGIFMEFENQKLYDQYTSHPDHIRFVQQYWLKEVEEFMEMDFVEWLNG